MNIANKITILRILLIPVFMFFMIVKVPYNMEIALCIFLFASLTDKLDGHLARKYNLITDMGKFLDPLADKLLVTAAFVQLIELGRIEAWIVFVILTREFAVTGLRSIAASQDIVIAASNFGKIKTVTQIIAIIALMGRPYLMMMIDFPLDTILVYLTLLITTISGLDYFYKNRAVFSKNM